MAKDETTQVLGKNIEELCAINKIIQEMTLNVPKPDFMDVVYDNIYSVICNNLLTFLTTYSTTAFSKATEPNF